MLNDMFEEFTSRSREEPLSEEESIRREWDNDAPLAAEVGPWGEAPPADMWSQYDPKGAMRIYRLLTESQQEDPSDTTGAEDRA